MKKFACAFCVLLACVMGLSACTPKLDDIKKTLRENDYIVMEMQIDIYALAYGVDKEDVEYFYYAKSSDNSTKLYIIAFNDKNKAKDFCEAQLEKNKFPNFAALQKGTVVFFGSSVAVQLFDKKES